MKTSPLFKAYASVSSVHAGKYFSHSEVVTTLAHRYCPCCGLAPWLLQALLVPTGTLGIGSHSDGFVFFYSLYDPMEKLMYEIKAMLVHSLPQMSWATAIPLQVGLVIQQQLRCFCAPRFTEAQRWEPHSYPACRVTLFQVWKAVASYLKSGGINSWSNCYQIVFLFSFEMDIWFFSDVLALPAGKTP